MLEFRFLYRLKSFFSGGAFQIGKKAKIRYLTHFRTRMGGRIIIGERFSAESGVVVDAQSGTIRMGDNVSLNDHAVLLGHGDITIGNNVRIAAHVVIASFDHNYVARDVPIRSQGVAKKAITIQEDVWVGAGAKILGGSSIATGCVIGANAVIKGSTVPYGVYVGSPARLLKMRGDEKKIA